MFTIAVSPCSNPELGLEECFRAYGALGYRRFEMFTSWCKSAANVLDDPRRYLDAAARYGFAYCCVHLPALTEDLDASLPQAVQAARFGAATGCRCAIVKAKTKPDFFAGTRALLDAIAELPLVPVVQNHKGTAITTLDDYLEVLDGVNDPRLMALLEVGHFHSVGVSWRRGYEALAGRIRHVHVKDQIGAQSVAFGAGEIDLPGLLARLVADGYGGDVVVEMETQDKENRLRYLGEALDYIRRLVRDLRA
ncbi:MAG TPA: sugar phosphate isomerase/epimerase [Planctomycetota bacterium]|nr:sugar phosphate isomerase/epimerase [Planctomycetota bacterium]